MVLTYITRRGTGLWYTLFYLLFNRLDLVQAARNILMNFGFSASSINSRIPLCFAYVSVLAGASILIEVRPPALAGMQVCPE